MTDSTPDRPALIARVRELDAEATPGPWREAARSKDGDESRFEMGQPWVCTTWLLLSKTDAALIAYYRTAAPALADECERLRERVAELEEALRECLGAATDGRYLGGAGARAGCAIVETCARAAPGARAPRGPPTARHRGRVPARAEAEEGAVSDKLRMNAYYYGFGETGCREVDLLLSAVACAGKAHHHTEGWGDSRDGEPSHVDLIQASADAAAKAFAASRAEVASLKAELSNEHAEWLEDQEEIADLEAANDWPLARKQLQAHRSEIRRLRTIIRTGGAAYRLERAAMGIPGGIDADGQPIAKPEGSG